MALTVNDLIVEAAGQYNDELNADTGDYNRVHIADWIRYFNSAVRSLVLVRPDAAPKTVPVELATGTTKQSLPTEAFRLIDIPRNMGSDGSTPGKIITPINREILDLTNQTWHQDTVATYIDHFTYDITNPRTFYVTPPTHGSTKVYVEMVYSYLPVTATDKTDAIVVADVFANPLIAWMTYRAYSIDDEEVNFGKGQASLQEFFNLLNIEIQSAVSVSPEKRE